MGSGGVSRHRRGRRAGRLVQARRRLAIDAEHQRRLALIPLSSPGPAPGTGDGAAAERSGNRQPTAPDAGTMSRRVERRPKTLTSQLPGERTAQLTAAGPVRAPARAAPRGQACIAHLNAQSIVSKIDDIILLLRNHDIDILCISETWLSPQVCDEYLPFPGYKILRCDREGRRGGGVAMLFRNECRVQQLTMPDAGPLETLWASVSWSGRQPDVREVSQQPTQPTDP